jgi:hypothetical protein
MLPLDVINITTFFRKQFVTSRRLDCKPYEQEETIASKDGTVPLNVIDVATFYKETISQLTQPED